MPNIEEIKKLAKNKTKDHSKGLDLGRQDLFLNIKNKYTKTKASIISLRKIILPKVKGKIEREIELLKIKIDREKHYHYQETSRFFPLVLILIGIYLLNQEQSKALLSGQISSGPFLFLILVLVVATVVTVYRLVFITRKNLEKYYNKLEKLLKKQKRDGNY